QARAWAGAFACRPGRRRASEWRSAIPAAEEPDRPLARASPEPRGPDRALHLEAGPSLRSHATTGTRYSSTVPAGTPAPLSFHILRFAGQDPGVVWRNRASGGAAHSPPSRHPPGWARL